MRLFRQTTRFKTTFTKDSARAWVVVTDARSLHGKTTHRDHTLTCRRFDCPQLIDGQRSSHRQKLQSATSISTRARCQWQRFARTYVVRGRHRAVRQSICGREGNSARSAPSACATVDDVVKWCRRLSYVYTAPACMFADRADARNSVCRSLHRRRALPDRPPFTSRFRRRRTSAARFRATAVSFFNGKQWPSAVVTVMGPRGLSEGRSCHPQSTPISDSGADTIVWPIFFLRARSSDPAEDSAVWSINLHLLPPVFQLNNGTSAPRFLASQTSRSTTSGQRTPPELHWIVAIVNATRHPTEICRKEMQV